MHEDNSYNWDDPENQDLANKVKELFIEKSRQTVYRTAVRMAILTYAPWLMPANLVTRANVPFREFIGRRSLPTDKVATFVADKVPLEVSPEVVSFIHRWSEFPFVGMGTGDLEFQRALMCIKARDVYENIGSEHIPGDVLALLPNYEKPVKYIFNNEAEQKEIAQEGMRKFFSFFSDLAEASHQLITPELRGQVIDVASAYLGSVEARRIDPMRENETVNLTERNMPVIHAEVSPTISRMMNEIADEIWPQDDICYFPRKVQYGRSLFKRLRH